MITKSEILLRIVDLEMQMLEFEEKLNKLEKRGKNDSNKRAKIQR